MNQNRDKFRIAEIVADERPSVSVTGSNASFPLASVSVVLADQENEEREDLDWDEETSVVKVLFPDTGDVYESPAPEGMGWQLYGKKEFKPYEAVASDFGGFCDGGDEYYLDVELPAEKDEETGAVVSESYIFSQQHQRCWLGDFGSRLTQDKCVVLETHVYVRDEEDGVSARNKYEMDFEDDDII